MCFYHSWMTRLIYFGNNEYCLIINNLKNWWKCIEKSYYYCHFDITFIWIFSTFLLDIIHLIQAIYFRTLFRILGIFNKIVLNHFKGSMRHFCVVTYFLSIILYVISQMCYLKAFLNFIKCYKRSIPWWL